MAALGIHEYTGVKSFFKKSHTKEMLERAEELMELLDLKEYRFKLARDVSLGYLRRLEDCPRAGYGPVSHHAG